MVTDTDSLQAHIDFVLELDKLKGVTRKTRPLGLDRAENSAEHSWQIAMMAASMAHLAAEPVDVNRVVGMLLVHDIGEIDTGDTLVYANVDWAAHKQAELAAVQRIFALLPDGRGAPFLALWQEFEAEATPEARFANAVDRAMPVLLNLANQGQSWRENGVSHARVVQRVGPQVQAGCPALWAWLQARLLAARDAGYFGAPD